MPGLDRRFESLRIAVRADRQRGARELQQRGETVVRHVAMAHVATAWICDPRVAPISAVVRRDWCHARRRRRLPARTAPPSRDTSRPALRASRSSTWSAAMRSTAVADLHRHVAVAEVIGRARERRGESHSHVQHRLGRGDHLDHASVGARPRRSPPRSTSPRGSIERHFLAGVERRAQAALLRAARTAACSVPPASRCTRRARGTSACAISSMLEQEVALRHRQHRAPARRRAARRRRAPRRSPDRPRSSACHALCTMSFLPMLARVAAPRRAVLRRPQRPATSGFRAPPARRR